MHCSAPGPAPWSERPAPREAVPPAARLEAEARPWRPTLTCPSAPCCRHQDRRPARRLVPLCSGPRQFLPCPACRLPTAPATRWGAAHRMSGKLLSVSSVAKPTYSRQCTCGLAPCFTMLHVRINQIAGRHCVRHLASHSLRDTAVGVLDRGQRHIPIPSQEHLLEHV